MRRTFEWCRMYYRAYLGGTRRLTLEQRGAYADILMLIYDNDGPLPDDDRWLAHALAVDIRLWKRLRRELVSLGKIAVTSEGIINARAEVELSRRRKQKPSADDLVSDHEDVPVATPLATPLAKPSSLEKTQQFLRASVDKKISREEEKKEVPPLSPKGDGVQIDLEEAISRAQSQAQEPTPKPTVEKPGVDYRAVVALWNEFAAQHKFAQVQTLNDKRRKAINARWSDLGGLDGFRLAIEGLKASDWHMGRNRPGGSSSWKPNFEFFVSGGIIKLYEAAVDKARAQPRATIRDLARGGSKPVEVLPWYHTRWKHADSEIAKLSDEEIARINAVSVGMTRRRLPDGTIALDVDNSPEFCEVRRRYLAELARPS